MNATLFHASLTLFLVILGGTGARGLAKTTLFEPSPIVSEFHGQSLNFPFAMGTYSQWYLNKISVPQVWDRYPLRKSVRVLVCDTGVQSSHPSLRGNVLPGKNFVDDGGLSEPTGNGHGTRIAGIIGANGLFGLADRKIYGIDPLVKIVPGKISNRPDGMADHKNTAKCIRWGADQGIRIVNLSYSGTIDNSEILSASDYLKSSGGILVVSAGNKGEAKSYPNEHSMLVVGATDAIDWKPPWSNSGDYLDLVAPGSAIDTLDMNSGYMTGRGTSFAAAVVSGVAALILSIEPDLNRDQLVEKILRSTLDLGISGRDSAFGWGRIDLSKYPN